MTIALGAARLTVEIGARRGPATAHRAALPADHRALDLALRLRTLVGAAQPERLRLVVG